MFDWLHATAGQQPYPLKACMGDVRYCPYPQLKAEGDRLRMRNDNASLAAARGLMMKRLAFSFERELRVLWIDREKHMSFRDFAFDPNALFEQFMIGPTTTKNEDRMQEVRQELIALGVDPKRITASTAYSPPT